METPEHDAQIDDPAEDVGSDEPEELDDEDDEDSGEEAAGTAEAPTGP